MTFECDRSGDRLTLRSPSTRWLSNGFDGGYSNADTAYNLTVPNGFGRTDLAAYVTERLGSDPTGPVLLTGVDQAHARAARYGPIFAVVTAGLSNPALLPTDESENGCSDHQDGSAPPRPGTVNILVGSDEPLTDGGLAGLLATVVEAKTATLTDLVGCTGTTSDAVVVGCPEAEGGDEFAGSATAVGNAARVCVRDALSTALRARYGDDLPNPLRAEHATPTSGSATVFQP